MDLERDPHHCGTCDRDCFATSCFLGSCAVVSLAQEAPGIHAFTADPSYLYWSNFDEGGIRRLSLAGGIPSDLAASPKEVFTLVAHDPFLYFSNYAEHAISRMPLTGGSWEHVARDIAPAEGLALDSDILYWGTDQGGTDGSLWAMPAAGATPVALVLAPRANEVVAAGDFVYATSFGDGAVMQAPKRGGATRVLSSGWDRPWGLTVVAEVVYWVNSGSGEVVAFDLASEREEVLFRGGKSLHSIAVANGVVYFSDWLAGVIWRLPLGGEARSIASAQDGPKSVLALGDWVYWANEGGQVNKVAR